MQHTSEFAAAVMLFDFCTDGIDAEKNGQPVSGLPLAEWRRMAGRDAGMSMYHFGMTIETVGKFDGKHAWLSSQMDLGVIKETKDIMNNSFPGWKRTRHAIAHRADFFLDPSKSREHRIPVSPGVTRTFWNRLQGRQFSRSLNGKVSICEVSEATLGRLIEIRRKFLLGL